MAQRQIPFSDLVSATKGFPPAALLGSGATGDVYRGTLDGVPIAVKRLKLPEGATPASRAELARRFHAELRVLGTYRHARIVRLLGFAAADGASAAHPFALVLELLDGGSLADWLRGPRGEAPARSHDGGAPLSALERVDAALGATAGLAYLHGLREAGEEAGPAGVVLHRDVKSANIGLAAHGGGVLYAKLLDCGLAKALRGGDDDAVPHAARGSTTLVVGTPGYMAPELGNTGASVATEVYALGVVLAELLTGARAAPDLVLSIARECRRDAAPLAARADAVWPRDAAASLAALVVDCTKQFDDERPASASVVSARLQALRELVDAGPPLVACVVCEERVAESTCAKCSERHVVCSGCINGVTLVDGGLESVRELGGAVRCPWRGAVGAGVVEACASRWTLEDAAFAQLLEPGTLLRLLKDAQMRPQHTRISLSHPAGKLRTVGLAVATTSPLRSSASFTAKSGGRHCE